MSKDSSSQVSSHARSLFLYFWISGKTSGTGVQRCLDRRATRVTRAVMMRKVARKVARKLAAHNEAVDMLDTP